MTDTAALLERIEKLERRAQAAEDCGYQRHGVSPHGGSPAVDDLTRGSANGAYNLGSVTPRWPMYLPARSA